MGADCACRVASDSYEIKVVKRKGHRTIHIQIQIFQTPVICEYMIECRRTQGNIFKYHEFFEEFEKQYKIVIEHLHKTTPDALSPAIKRKSGQQIKFREIANDGTHSRSVSANLEPGLPENAMHEISRGSQSVPMGQGSPIMKDEEAAASKVYRKSSASSASSVKNHPPSQRSSVSEPSQSEQKENLTSFHSSASPTPTHQNQHSNASLTLTDEELNQIQPHSDSSQGDEMEVHKEVGNELKPTPENRHRRSSSGQG